MFRRRLRGENYVVGAAPFGRVLFQEFAGSHGEDTRIGQLPQVEILLRGRQPIYDGGLATLRRFQDDVKEVRVGLECGIKLGDFSEYQVGDIIECYQLEQVAQKL